MFNNRVLLVAVIACTVFLFSAVLPQKSISSSTSDSVVADSQQETSSTPDSVVADSQQEISSSAPDSVVIDSQQYKKKTKGSLSFSHGDHIKSGATCTECHHEYKDGANIWQEGDAVKKCGECHDGEKKNGNAPSLKNAFHNQCMECHKGVDDEAKAPVKKCNSCHKK